jgi:hypothetical protein
MHHVTRMKMEVFQVQHHKDYSVIYDVEDQNH